MQPLSKPPDLPIQLERGRCLLFAYGQLQPGRKLPRTATRAWPDRAHGLLYNLGLFPAAIHIGAVSSWLRGYVIEIAESELVGELDVYEEVDEGLYRRIRTVTEARCQCQPSVGSAPAVLYAR